MITQQQRQFISSILGAKLSGDIVAEMGRVAGFTKNMLQGKPPAANFFQQHPAQKEAEVSAADKFFKHEPRQTTPGESAFFDSNNPRQVEAALKANHEARRKLANEVDKLFKGKG